MERAGCDGRVASASSASLGRPRVIRIQRNSSTIFAGELAGRSSAAGSSDGWTRKRSASPMSDPRAAARNVAYSSASTRAQPNARRIGSSHGGTACGRIANSALAAAVSPNETETSPSRLARNAAGERASAAYARPNAASCSSSRSVSGAASGGSVAPNRDHHDANALDERPVSSRRRWRHPQARRNRRSASRCARTDRSIAGRVVSRRTARLVSAPALAANARSVAAT